MGFDSFVDMLRQQSQWLADHRWMQWCLIAAAASLSFVLLLKITRRRRRQLAGFARMGYFDERALPGKAAQADTRGRRQQASTDPAELVSHPEISIRQLRREIFKRDQVEARLEHQVEELTIANEQLRQQVAESKETCAYFERKADELLAANSLLDDPAAQKKVEAKEKEPPRKEQVRPKATEKKDQKQCRRCKKHKPLTEFHKNASSHDGLARWCKTCKTKAAKESRKKRASKRRTTEQQADMCADAPLCVLHHRQTDRLKNVRRHASHAGSKVSATKQPEHRSHRFRSQLSSPGLRCPRRQKQREQGNSGTSS